MKRAAALLGVFALTAASWSQDAGRSRGKHDGNGQGCAFCHVQRTLAVAPDTAPDSCDSTTLWDCKLSSRTFRTYEDAKPDAPDTQAEMSSMLCASCHDGIGTTTMSGAPRLPNHAGSAAATGLQNEHPINVSHDPAKDATLAALAIVTQQVKLFGPMNSVQCSTCHDPHGSADSKLLRKPNTDSALCLTCHL